MVPGLLLSDLVLKWKEQLAASAAVGEFCLKKFGKKPHIFVGVDPANPPASTDCPYIIIRPVLKKEGNKRKQYRYTAAVSWSVVNSVKTITNEITELAGLYDCDKLGQIILNALAQASPANPISYVKYRLPAGESNTFPQFEGSMEIKVYVTTSMGGKLSY